MTDTHSDEYQQGIRDGRIISLEASVHELTVDVKKLKSALWSLYGAIALVTFAPELMDFLSRGN